MWDKFFRFWEKTGIVERPPEDNWNFMKLVMGFHGVGIAIAWYTFNTAVKDYFVEDKLFDSTHFRNNYLVYVAYASQLANVIFSWLIVFEKVIADVRVGIKERILWSLIIEVMLFVFTMSWVPVETTRRTTCFFLLTLLCIFSINGANAIYQSSIFAIATRLPMEYTGFVFMGFNLCGTLLVLLAWSTATVRDKRMAAIFYFFYAIVMMLLNIASVLHVFPVNKFFRYHNAQALTIIKAEYDEEEAVPYERLFHQCKYEMYNMFMVYFVSFAIHPAVQCDIVLNYGSNLGKHFVMFTCYLTFYVFAFCGNISATYLFWPRGPFLVGFTTLRILFIPLFLMCNYHPYNRIRTAPVKIPSDWWYWVLSVLFGWSEGHASALAMMFIRNNVEPKYQSMAAMIGSAMLVSGILAGTIFSAFCPFLVSKSKQ